MDAGSAAIFTIESTDELFDRLYPGITAQMKAIFEMMFMSQSVESAHPFNEILKLLSINSTNPGVYGIFARSEKPRPACYIGHTKNLSNRKSQHLGSYGDINERASFNVAGIQISTQKLC